MPCTEMDLWMVYISWRNELEKEAFQKAQQEAKANQQNKRTRTFRK